MTYDPALFALTRLTGSAKLALSFRLGESRLGMTDAIHTPVAVASMTTKDGYTVDTGGALSLDPATGTAAMATRHAGAVAPPGTPPVRVNDAVQATYGSTVIFNGICTKVGVTLDPDPDHAGYTRRWTYTFASQEAWLLAEIVTYGALPSESALVRVRRFFTVDASALTPTSATLAATVVPADAGGSKSMLEIARDFTTATGLALRVSAYSASDPKSLVVLEPTAAPVAIGAADTWASEITYEGDAGVTLVPTGVGVEADNTELMSGVNDQTITPYRLGTTFRLGTARLGTSLTMRRGFLAGDRLDILGQTVRVAHISQAFGTEHYRASLELVA